MTSQTERCDICRIGRCKPVKVPYLYWVDDQVMVMPNSPAFACDICGQVYFDPAFLVLIECLLQELENNMEMRRTAHLPIRREVPVGVHSSRSDG
jgi:YgiT-type zinc finger domain-containing protein